MPAMLGGALCDDILQQVRPCETQSALRIAVCFRLERAMPPKSTRMELYEIPPKADSFFVLFRPGRNCNQI